MDKRVVFTLTEGEGPVIATALHHGHDVRPEAEELMAISEEDRLREEDPFTGPWTEIAPTRLVVHRSRFELDMNRPRHRAVYLQPEDAWGLEVWKEPPSDDLLERSRRLHDAFYATAKRVLDKVVAREGHFVVFDIHSYNHQRGGAGGPFDPQSQNPDINIGTGSMDRPRWAPVVERVMAELRACEHLGRRLDVRENVRFKGLGNFSRWVHGTYPETGCSIPIEHKKLFMDEWSGQLYEDLHDGLLELLHTVAAAVHEELARRP